MTNTVNQSQKNYNTKVAPVSCHCKLSLLVVHLQYLNDKRKNRMRHTTPSTAGESQTLFYQYI